MSVYLISKSLLYKSCCCTVEDKMLGANGFWLIKHSIWEQFSWFLVCIYSFYTQKWGTKNLSKIGHSCQVPKMA